MTNSDFKTCMSDIHRILSVMDPSIIPMIDNIMNKFSMDDIALPMSTETSPTPQVIIPQPQVSTTTTVEQVEEQKPTLTTSTGIIIPSGMMYEYIKNRLTEERGSIKKVYQKAVDNGRDITIFDVFNVKYDGKRDKPIRTEDISVVVRHIQEKYQYSIPTISKVIKDNIDIIIDATQFHQIRKSARKAGKTAHETERPLTRDKKLTDDEDHIANVLTRSPIELNLLQAFLHMRHGVCPCTIFDVYRVKQKIATVTDNDIRQICVNLQRQSGMVRPSEIADKIKEEIDVSISRDEVINYIEWYEKNKRLNASTMIK